MSEQMAERMRMKVGVLASGSGTNLQALLDASQAPGYPARIAVVVCNVPTAHALERARQAGVPAVVVDHKAFPSRAEFEATLLGTLQSYGVEAVCLAGFMRLLGGEFLRAFPSGVLNIHPALLPAFPGLHAARQALAHGAKITGCSVHLVDEGTDTGPIVAQAAVPVLPGDDEASLSARIQREEHRLYPLVLRWLAEHRLEPHGRVVHIIGEPVVDGTALRNPGRSAP